MTLVMVIMFFGLLLQPLSAEPVSIEDPRLEGALRKALNKPKGLLESSDLERLTSLDADELGILSLGGLEHCVNLEQAFLDGNSITRLDELALLQKLRVLTLDRNKIINIKSLESLLNLKKLTLKGNPIQDLSPALAFYPFLEEKDFEIPMEYQEMVDRKAKRILEDIIKPEYGPFEKAVVIHDWLIKNVEYDMVGFLTETIKPEQYSEYGALLQGLAVCAGYATAYVELLRRTGVEARYVSGMVNGSKNPREAHAWCLVNIDGLWYHVDPTWDDTYIPKEGNRDINYQHFLLDDLSIQQRGNRDWGSTQFPKATSRRYLYLSEKKYYEGISTNQLFMHAHVHELLELLPQDYRIIPDLPLRVVPNHEWSIETGLPILVEALPSSVMVIKLNYGAYDYSPAERVSVQVSHGVSGNLRIQPPAKGFEEGAYWLFIASKVFGKNGKPVKHLFYVTQEAASSETKPKSPASGVSPKGPVFFGKKEGFSMQSIPDGRFVMGNASGPGDEKPPREVSISSFIMGTTEITNQQFAMVYNKALEDGLIEADHFVTHPKGQEDTRLVGFSSAGSNRGLEFEDDRIKVIPGREKYPVTGVSWYGAMFFCHMLNTIEGRASAINIKTWTVDPRGSGYRLPTEAEWEYAARGGNKGAQVFAGGDTFETLGWTNEFHPAGQKKPNGFGLLDCSGNAWEWCADWYYPSYYMTAPSSDPPGPSAELVKKESIDKKVIRGGGVGDEEFACRVANRHGMYPRETLENVGFRIVLK